VHRGAGEVAHPPGRRAERQLDDPGGDVPGVDGLEPQPAGRRDDRQRRHLLRDGQHQVVELGRAQRRPPQPGPGDGLLGAQLGPEVAQRDAVGADDRDEHQVPHAGAGRGAHEVRGRAVVALGAARQVQDDLGAGHGALDALAGEQVGGHVLDAGGGLARVPAEHAHVAPGGAQQRHHEAAQRSGAAGDQQGCGHVDLPFLRGGGGRSHRPAPGGPPLGHPAAEERDT
jgi:hypothetical protein